MPATEVDHRIPLWRGGTDDRRNLQGLCSRCHRLKTGKEFK
jgi:5-methylcytosine-specific restriction protein A